MSTIYESCPTSQIAAFDYSAMALEALRQRDILHQRLAERKAQGPASPDQELSWNRENSILYNMYLEQRFNHLEFSRRARLRGQIHEGCVA